MAWAVVLLASPGAAQEPPTFGTEVRAVEVDVLVTRDGRPVTGLAAADFELLDDGARQDVEVAAGPGAAVNAVLVLDVSASVVGERLAELKAAAGALLDGLRPGDHATLVTFAEQVRLAAPATTDVAALRAALAAATPGGSTALNDAVFAALQLADRRNGRPVLMVFSDGDDRVSWLSAEDLRRAAREADAVIYVAELPAPAPPESGVAYMIDQRGDESRRQETAATGRRFSGERAHQHATRLATALEELADVTGGRVWPAASGEELRQAFLALLEEVRGRYLLRFEPTARERSGWHALEVKTRVKGQVRARRGYHDGGR
jgi:VWFA-related protein